MTETMDPVFGRMITAMITPFSADGRINLDEAAALATYLVDVQENDSLVINGTTGESPTTTDAEKKELLKVVSQAVGDRAQVLAGVGTFSTEHTLDLAHDAQNAGADGLLIVTPYYSRPPQDALAQHFLTIGEATELPIMVYDIPHRSGVPVEFDTMLRIAEHPRIVAVKDAGGNPVLSSQVISQTGLAYYSGDDAMTLPLLAVGGVGLVGTSTHFTGAAAKQMIEAYLSGDVDRALSLHQQLLPVFTGVFATQAVMLVKAAFNARGRQVGPVRAPLLEATRDQAEAFLRLLDDFEL